MVSRGVACDECVKRCERNHKKQRKFSSVKARFFKVMIGKDYSKVMYLPPVFAKKVKDLTNKKIQIKDVLGDEWSVKMSRVEGLLAFQEGWKKFSQDHNLEEGDFLIFSYINGSNFIANVFGRSGCERIEFNNEKPRPCKKSRRDHRTTSEDEPYQTDSGVKPISPTSLFSGDESQRLKAKRAAAIADFDVLHHLPMPVNFEDSVCMINWDNRRYEEKHMNLLYDISNFEMENGIFDAEKFQKPLSTRSGSPQAETTQHDANLESASETKTPVSYNGITKPIKAEGDGAKKQTKTPVVDAETSRIQTEIFTGNYGDKFEKAADVKRPISHTKITDQFRKKGNHTQMAPHSSQTGGHFCDAFMNNFCKNSSDNSNLEKGKLHNVCESQDGCHAIKKERVEMEDKDIVFGAPSSRGKEPPVQWNHAQVISPQVKVECDLSHEIDPLDAVGSSFSAVVKSPFYLELPEDIARAPRSTYKWEGMVVYLRDSVGRLWPFIYREYYSGRVLTINWTEFCQQNNVMPGDKCKFLVEDVKRRIYRVDIAHGSG